jgi:hypothetical protein
MISWPSRATERSCTCKDDTISWYWQYKSVVFRWAKSRVEIYPYTVKWIDALMWNFSDKIMLIKPYHAKYFKWTCPSINLDKTICHFLGTIWWFELYTAWIANSADRDQTARMYWLILVCTGCTGKFLSR